MSAYDAWLEKPYQDQARIEEAHERFQEGDEYAAAFEVWCSENNVPSVSHWSLYIRRLFEETPDYADAFEEWVSACE